MKQEFTTPIKFLGTVDQTIQPEKPIRLTAMTNAAG